MYVAASVRIAGNTAAGVKLQQARMAAETAASVEVQKARMAFANRMYEDGLITSDQLFAQLNAAGTVSQVAPPTPAWMAPPSAAAGTVPPSAAARPVPPRDAAPPVPRPAAAAFPSAERTRAVAAVPSSAHARSAGAVCATAPGDVTVPAPACDAGAARPAAEAAPAVSRRGRVLQQSQKAAEGGASPSPSPSPGSSHMP